MAHDPHHPLIRRALFALARPLARLAASQRLSLTELKRLIESAYYAELRQRDLTVRETCDLLEISPSKAALLAQSLRQALLHATPSVDALDADIIAALLWHEPLSLAKLNQILPGARYATLRAILDDLLKQGRVRAEHRSAESPYRLVLDPTHRPEDRWIEQLDQLAQQLDDAAAPVLAHVASLQTPDVQTSERPDA
jgi:hypothetical protein